MLERPTRLERLVRFTGFTRLTMLGRKNMQDYHKLLVWKRAVELVKLTYRLTAHFPKDELYGLTSQLKRAVLSVAANIVEGRGKATDKDFLRYLYIAN